MGAAEPWAASLPESHAGNFHICTQKRGPAPPRFRALRGVYSIVHAGERTAGHANLLRAVAMPKTARSSSRNRFNHRRVSARERRPPCWRSVDW
jgi:hypothetical protein